MSIPPLLATSPCYVICRLAQVIQRAGMHPGRSTLLMEMRNREVITLAALARRCGVSTTAVSLMMRRLEDEGLIDRDGPLILTDKGEAVRGTIPAAWSMLDARALDGLTENERALLTDFLRRITL